MRTIDGVGLAYTSLRDELLGLAADPDSDPVFKNHQDDLNMDVLCRAGQTQQGTALDGLSRRQMIIKVDTNIGRRERQNKVPILDVAMPAPPIPVTYVENVLHNSLVFSNEFVNC